MKDDSVPPSRVLATPDGYVYDVRPDRNPGSLGPGLWMAVSSGAIARLDETTGSVRILGYASPRATAIADGPHPGEIAYADPTGVVLLDATGKSQRVLESLADTVEDLAASPDATSMLLAQGQRISVLDLARREIIGFVPADGQNRLTPWDDEGSVLAWSFDRVGGAEAVIVPTGRSLAKVVAARVSNLEVDRGKLVLRR